MTESTRAIVLPGEVSVVNLGLSLFADAVRDQAAPVEEVDWRIPAGGQMDLVDALEQLEGPRAAGIDQANAEAVRRLDRSVPLLVDVAPAGTLIPDLSGRMLLHCGPAIEWAAGLRPAPSLDAGRRRCRGVGRDRRAGRPDPRRRKREAPAGLPLRHRDADGECNRSVGAGLRRRQPRRRHTGIRPDQPGAGGDRVVRT